MSVKQQENLKDVTTSTSPIQDHLSKIGGVSWCLIWVGIALRLSLFLMNHSLETSEAALSLNILRKSFRELMQPLDMYQAAPIGFLFVQKLAVLLFGGSEYALRLFPLICGIASLFLFRSLVVRYLSSIAACVAMGLFSVADYLIMYSSRVKQYSVDVVCVVIVLWSARFLNKEKLNSWRAILLALLGGLTVWFSHPAVFVLASISAVSLVECVLEKDRSRFVRLACIFSLWALNFYLFYIFALSHLSKDQFFLTLWNSGFMPFPPKSLGDLQWFLNTFFEVFTNPGGLSAASIASLPFLVGAYSLFRDKRHTFSLLFLPILFVLIASGLHKYPFKERLILFIVPLLLVPIGEGVERIWASTRPHQPAIGFILIFLLFLNPVVSAVYHIWHLSYPEESKPVLSQLGRHWRPGDSIFVFCNAQGAFQYYAGRYGLSGIPYIAGKDCGDAGFEGDEEDVQQLLGHKRVWVFFSHMLFNREVHWDFYLYSLNKHGRRLDAFRAPGAAVYLYDLSE